MGNLHKFVGAFTELSDAPASITANQFVRGNGGGTALVFFDVFGSANSWTATQTFRNINPDVDDTRVASTNALRWSEVVARRVRAVDTAGTGTRTITQAAATSGILAGFLFANPGATAEIELSQSNPNFRPALVAGSAYAFVSGGTARLRNTFGGSTVLGSAFTNAAQAATVEAIAYGSFCGGYAYTQGGATAASLVQSSGSGAFVWGYAVAAGGSATVSASGAGAFCLGRVEGASRVGMVNANGGGSFVAGLVASGGTAAATIQTTAGGAGAFCQGRAVGGTGSGATATLQATGSGAFAQGTVQGGTAASTTAAITASGAGAFAQGRCVAGAAAAAVTASANGAFAQGSASTGETIAATAANAAQFGPGTNATPNSLQVGANFLARANGGFGGANANLTLGASATTFAATSSLMTITGNIANVLATITGGFSGMRLVLIFTDALVTVTDDNTHAANTVDLSSAFVSVDDAVLELVHDGVSWYEVGRSIN